jgi:hypothetical protein
MENVEDTAPIVDERKKLLSQEEDSFGVHVVNAVRFFFFSSPFSNDMWSVTVSGVVNQKANSTGNSAI